ncbi:MAG: YaiI/YqxD family protein [Alphaproteobacteria bacterium]|nr:YaiI/YqxD family protein [Alphaproteobacteria bacterium]
MSIYIDADACPVKDEIYKVAFRYDVPVWVVSNSFMRIPDHPLVSRMIVSAGPDVADDHIAERADENSVVITADILLAERCLNSNAIVISPNGKPFTENSIGSAVATRALMEGLRSTGDITGGPPPFSKADRSRFLSALDQALVRLKRNN